MKRGRWFPATDFHFLYVSLAFPKGRRPHDMATTHRRTGPVYRASHTPERSGIGHRRARPGAPPPRLEQPAAPPHVGKKELLEGHAVAHPFNASLLGLSRQEVDNNGSLRVSCGGVCGADWALFGTSTRRSGREVAVRGAVLPDSRSAALGRAQCAATAVPQLSLIHI